MNKLESADKVFSQVEKRHDFFKISIDGFPIWDILRFPIFHKVYFRSRSIKKTYKKDYSLIAAKAWRMIKSVVYFLFVKGDNFFVTTSRDLADDGLYFDKAAASLLDYFADNAFIHETLSPTRRYKYAAMDSMIFFFRSQPKKKNKELALFFAKVKVIIDDEIERGVVEENDLWKWYSDFQSQYRYFRFLFKLKKFKRVFVTNDGYKKGLILAAKTAGVEVFENQHGSIEVDHLAYSYPKWVTDDSQVILPTYLLTFGRFWGCDINIPIKKIVPVGNDYFKNVSNGGQNCDLLVVSSILHASFLLEFVVELASKYSKMRIVYKLHSNELSQLNDYKYRLDRFEHVVVDGSSHNISGQIAKSTCVLLIASTVLYQALDQNKKVFIYKRSNFERQKSLFGFENVILVDNVDDFISGFTAPLASSSTAFFDRFDASKISGLIR